MAYFKVLGPPTAKARSRGVFEQRFYWNDIIKTTSWSNRSGECALCLNEEFVRVQQIKSLKKSYNFACRSSVIS